MCSPATSIAPNTQMNNLGTAATCHEVDGSMGGYVCGNFVDPRTFTINGTEVNCVGGGSGNLPAARNGGWCFEATAGDFSYAYFNTYNVK
jgi:hypothetical protein